MNPLQKMKLALIEKGYSTRTMTDDEIRAAYHIEIGGAPAPTPAPVPTPAPAPAPAPAPRNALETAIAAMIDAKLQGFNPESQLDENQIQAMIEKHASPTITIEVKNRDTVKTITGAHKALEDVLFELNNDEHVYLYGPAGSGKTTLAEQAATALDKDFYKSGAILSKHELIGFVDAGGAYHTTAFRTAFETGSLFLFDEMDASAPEAILALNDAMSNGSYTFPDSPIALKKGEGFLAIGCANTIGKGATREYVGRAPLDGASRNRFAKLEIDYDEQLELRLGRDAFKQYGGADDARHLFDTIYSEIKAVRKHVAKRKLSIILSPRDTIRCAKSMAGGKTADDVRDSVIYVEFTDDQRKAVEV